MALSGTIYSSSFGNNSFRLKLTWSATQNVTANTSTITTKLYFESLQSWASFSDGTSSAVNINIDGSNSSGSANSSISGNQSKHIYTHTRTVGHASDGTKSLTISAGHTIDISYSGSTIGSRSLSGSISLNTIPRVSTPTLSNNNVPLGTALTIYTNRSSSSFTHTIYYDFGSTKKTIATKTSSSSVSYTPTADLANELPNSTTGWGNIWVETFNGNTSLGKKSVRLNVSVPSNATYNPTIGAISLAESNSAVTTAVGNYYIQGKSKIKISATGGTKYGARITSITFKVKTSNHAGSLSGTTATTYSSPSASGVHAVVATITDSRGRTATSSTSFTVTAYSSPRISAFTSSRMSNTQTTIRSSGTATFTPIGTANTVTLKLYYKLKSATAWTTAKTVTATSGSSLTTGNYDLTSMPITNSYEVKLDVYDELTPTVSTQTIQVGTASFPMSWGKNGIAIGKIYEESATLEIGGSVRFADTVWAGNGTEGFGAMYMNNGDITGINGLFFNDQSQINNGEGLMFLREGKVAGSMVRSDYDNFFMNDGNAYFNGIKSGDLLWQGASYLNSSTVITPSKNIADCPNGWALLWSDYNVGEGENNFDYAWTYVLKVHNKGGSIRTTIGYAGESATISKVYYITNGVIKGHPDSDATSAQKDVVLREVRAF